MCQELSAFFARKIIEKNAAPSCVFCILTCKSALQTIKTRREKADARSLCALSILLGPKRRNRE